MVLLFIENTEREGGLWGYNEFGLGYVAFKMDVGHPSGDRSVEGADLTPVG